MIQPCKSCEKTYEQRKEMTSTQDLDRMKQLQEEVKSICDECLETLPFVPTPSGTPMGWPNQEQEA